MSTTTTKPKAGAKKPPLLGDDGFKPYVEGLWQPRRWWSAVSHPHRSMRQIAGEGSIYALLILFGLNAVDELDRTGFGILLPTAGTWKLFLQSKPDGRLVTVPYVLNAR